MTQAVLGTLAGLWLVYFGLWFRETRRSPSSRPDSINSFSRALGALARPFADQRGGDQTGGRVNGSRPGPRPSGVFDPPGSASEATVRRQGLIALLAAAALVSLMAVPSLGAPALAVHVLADLTLLVVVGVVAARHLGNRARPAVVTAARVAAGENVAADESVVADESNVLVLHPPRPADEEDGVVVPLRRAADG